LERNKARLPLELTLISLRKRELFQSNAGENRFENLNVSMSKAEYKKILKYLAFQIRMNNLKNITILVVLFCIIQRIDGFRIVDIFGPSAPSKPQITDLDILRHSRGTRQELTNFLSGLGDLDHDGMISFEEFSSVYSHFIKILTGKPAKPELIQSRFNMGDHIKRDRQLDSTEFAWTLNSDFEFIFKNYLVANGHPAVLDRFLKNLEQSSQPQSLQRAIKSIYSGTFMSNPIDCYEFKEFLMYLSNTIGFNLGFRTYVHHDYCLAADLNQNGEVDLDELAAFAPDFMNNHFLLVQNFVSDN